SEAADLACNLVGIACSIVADGHRACRNRHRHILDAAYPPHSRIDLGCAGRTIHTVDAKANLVLYFTHDLLFSALLLNYVEQGLHPLVTRGASAKMITNVAIGEASKASGVKVPTIRYYEQIGLLPVPPRTEGNRRLYDRNDV